MTAAMPLREIGQHFEVTTAINGQDSNLVLDTGAFATSVTPAAAARLGLSPHRLGGQVYGVGGAQELFSAKAATMKIGRMNADGAILAVSKMGLFDGSSGPDGLFGMNMMSHYDIDIDLVGHKVVLFEAEGDCSKPTVTLGPDLYSVKLTDIDRDQEAVVTVVIEGRKFRALLDTGAATTAMFRQGALRLGVDLSGLAADTQQRGRGVGDLGVLSMKHVFKSVSIGSLRIENMPITILSQRDTGIDRHHIGSLIEDADGDDPGIADMLLGADFMQKVHLWISHSSHTLIMQFPPKASPPLPKN